MSIEECYLNCFIAMQRAQNPSFKKIWLTKMRYFERKILNDIPRNSGEAHSKAAH